MADYAAEKTFDPTPRRRQQAREAGEFATSHDLVSAAILVAGTGALLWLANSAAVALRQLMVNQLGSPAVLALDQEAAVTTWHHAFQALVPVVLPLLGTIVVAAVMINVLQVGTLWLPQRVAPDWNRVSPLTGWRRIFSWGGAIRLLQAVAKTGLVAGIAGWSLYQQRHAILALPTLEIQQVSGFVSEIVLWTSLKIGGLLLALALLDYAYQWRKHEQGLKMTADELREEMRNLQGDPQAVARRRQVRRDIASHRSAGARTPHASKLDSVPPVAGLRR